MITDEEKEFLKYFADSLDVWIKFPGKRSDEVVETKQAINTAQNLITMRIARGVDLDYWYVDRI